MLGSIVKRVFWLIVAGSVAVVVLRYFPWSDPAGGWSFLQEKSVAFQQFCAHILDKLPHNLPSHTKIQLPK